VRLKVGVVLEFRRLCVSLVKAIELTYMPSARPHASSQELGLISALSYPEI
jgi:hypothetical protein